MRLRQYAVDAIVFLWPIVPRRLRVWALLNDREATEYRRGAFTDDMPPDERRIR